MIGRGRLKPESVLEPPADATKKAGKERGGVHVLSAVLVSSRPPRPKVARADGGAIICRVQAPVDRAFDISDLSLTHGRVSPRATAW
jgi:hypothetical protein